VLDREQGITDDKPPEIEADVVGRHEKQNE